MSDRLPRRTVIFIVRVWAEYLEQTPPVWRGEIEHVESKEVTRFGTMSAMNDWIGHYLALPGETSDEGEG